MLLDDPKRFQSLLGEFRFDRLFNELGWDRAGTKPHSLQVGEDAFTLTPVAQKRGVMIFRCSPDSAGGIPLRPTLLKIEKEAAKIAHEHLLIFTDVAETRQTWLWVARIPGAPAATRTHSWRKGASGEALRQKLQHIAFSLDEEEALTLTGVTVRLRDAFDRDRVTKKFYEHFSREHLSFAGFIQGLEGNARRDWYASLMLNRLMFVYFIQRKGFLDDNRHYLSDRLRKVQTEVGKGEFHSFYRLFLRTLFHEGLGQPRSARRAELQALLGEVPYLNGGLFSIHELEEAHPDIDIPDEAFERLFRFFDDYDWHLDDRPLAAGKEINPDVLGYIFEKYINQKQMGAYYTKEDITEYIARNTVIPFLLERAKARCKVAFEGEASVWALLRDTPDKYLYPAMKRGVIDAHGDIVAEDRLPDFVQTGMKDPKARMFDRRYNLGEAGFHTATGEAGGLPTETWREYVERRTRCLDLWEKMQRGEIASIDNLVTYNLDIRQFMQDVIDTCSGPELLRAIWQAIIGRSPEKSHERFRHGISILDPTCGSGAFLFAALNILEPLYEACLERMEGFVQDAERASTPHPNPLPKGEGVTKSHPDFRRALEEVAKHPSRRYYIYRSIILHNLFGVDLMPEAVEICKLRLFLKLVAQVDAGSQLEPLPDIDFNIRAGNTLVGFATASQFDASADLASDHALMDEIKADIADFGEALDRFREQQDVHGGRISPADKRALRERREKLAAKLDRYLALEYGKDPDKPEEFAEWRDSHQPFHWFAEFAGIMAEGGFDVVIGNPPYVEMSRIRSSYVISQATRECGNLYAPVVERSISIKAIKGWSAMIVPLSLVSTERMREVRGIVTHGKTWLTSFDMRPASLFEGIAQRLTIFIKEGSERNSIAFSGGYRRWPVASRTSLFQTISYVELLPRASGDIAFKASAPIEISIFKKLGVQPLELQKDNTASPVYIHRICRYFVKVFDFIPHFRDVSGQISRSEDYKPFNFNLSHKEQITAYLNSSTFYWYWRGSSDGFHCGYRDVFRAPYKAIVDKKAQTKLVSETQKLFESLCNESQIKQIRTTRGIIEYQEFYPGSSKSFADQIDLLLGEIWGLGLEETDFLINYDIKYRMGGVDGEE